MNDNLTEGAVEVAQPQAVGTPVADANEVINSEAGEKVEAPKEADKPGDLAAELEKLRRAKSKDDKRIGKLTAIRYQAQKEAEELRKRLSEYESKQTKGSNKPEEKDFEGRPYSDYLDAVADWKVEQKLSEREKKSSDETANQRQAEYIREREEIMDENGEKAAKDFPDFNNVISEISAELREMAPHVRQALLEADNGAYALYALAKEGGLEYLNGLSPYRVAATIARMEDKGIAMAKSKPVSKAPAPLKPNTGTAPNTKTVDSMSADELRKWRQS